MQSSAALAAVTGILMLAAGITVALSESAASMNSVMVWSISFEHAKHHRNRMGRLAPAHDPFRHLQHWSLI
jgi:hypothetical protein